ncbi:MAG: DoxX family protein [Candidatus Acidiferrales bacterium]
MNDSSRYTMLFARILLSVVFLVSGTLKIVGFNTMVGYAAAVGLPLPAVSLAIAAAIELIGGVMLLTGYKARVAAWVLFAYLIPTTLLFHHFWAIRGPEQLTQMVNFLKNLAIMGGLLVVTSAGPGRLSLGNPATESR